MTHQEFIRLCGFSKAKMKQRQQGFKGTTKRTAKKGRIQVLEYSRVVSEVGAGSIHNRPQFQKPIYQIREPYVKRTK